MRRFVTMVPALAVLIATLAVMFAAGPVLDRASNSRTAATITLARQQVAQDDILARIDAAVMSVADSVRPSVAHVEVISGQRGRRSRSNGSGWVFDQRGHVVTNAHVVRGARENGITVEFPNGRIVSGGRVVGIDPFTDIAVIKIDQGPGVFPLARATSEPVRQGQRAYAFGSPFGFKFSMSEGIISGLGRAPGSAAAFGGFTNYIQTDAAVNPGNSGGPLVNVRGELIGMNVAIATGRDTQGTTEGDSAGISFAIPLETIEHVVPQLIGEGRVARGFLGIQFRSSPPRQVTLDDGTEVAGLLINGVTEGGPSDRAGLRQGDVIVRLRDLAVNNGELLRSIVSASSAGDGLPVEVARGGELLNFVVTLGEMPASILAGESELQIRIDLGLDYEVRDDGLYVSRIFPGLPADRAGLEVGQRILRVGDRGVDRWIDAVAGFNDAGLLAGETVGIRVLTEQGARRDLEVRINY